MTAKENPDRRGTTAGAHASNNSNQPSSVCAECGRTPVSKNARVCPECTQAYLDGIARRKAAALRLPPLGAGERLPLDRILGMNPGDTRIEGDK